MYLFPNTVTEQHAPLSKIKRMVSVEEIMYSAAQYINTFFILGDLYSFHDEFSRVQRDFEQLVSSIRIN